MLRQYLNDDVLPFYMEDGNLYSTAGSRYDEELTGRPIATRDSSRETLREYRFVKRKVFSVAEPDRMYVSDKWTGKNAKMDFEAWRTEYLPFGYNLWQGGLHGSPLRQSRQATYFIQYEYEKNAFVDVNKKEQYQIAERTHHITPVLCCDDNCSCLWLLPHDMESYGPFESGFWDDDETYAPFRRPVFLDYYDNLHAQQRRQFLSSMILSDAEQALPPSSNHALHMREFFHGQHPTSAPVIKKRKWGVVTWPARSSQRALLRKMDLWGAVETMKRLSADTWSFVLTFLPYNEKCAFAMFYDESTLKAYGCLEFHRSPTSSDLVVHRQTAKMQELHKWRGLFDLNNFCNRHVHRGRVLREHFYSSAVNSLVARTTCATSDMRDAIFEMVSADERKQVEFSSTFQKHVESHQRYMTAWVDLDKLLKLLTFAEEPDDFDGRACWYIERMNELERLRGIYQPNAKSMSRLVTTTLAQGDCALQADLKQPYQALHGVYYVNTTVSTFWRQLSDMASMSSGILLNIMASVHRFHYFNVPCPYNIKKVQEDLNHAKMIDSLSDNDLAESVKREFLSRHAHKISDCSADCLRCGCSHDLMVDAHNAWANIYDFFFIGLTDEEVADSGEMDARFKDQLRTLRIDSYSEYSQYKRGLEWCSVTTIRPGFFKLRVCPPQAWNMMDSLVKLRTDQRECENDLWAEENL